MRDLARRPTVSVVIPCHNYGRFLASAASSVTSQTDVEVDVLIIDDASTDGSQEVAKSLAESDPRIRVICHEHNAGHIATYNEGIAAATGDYFVLLSADDLLTPGSLRRATALLDAHPSVGFCYGRSILFTDEPSLDARQAVTGWTIWDGEDWIVDRCRKGLNATWSPEVVMRTSVQHQIGGYRADLPYSADMEMWLRAATVADVGVIEGADQAYYRRHGQSLTDKLSVSPIYDLEGRHDAFAAVLTPPSSVSGAARLYRLACLALADAALREASGVYGGDQDGDAAELEAFALEIWPSRTLTPRWISRNIAKSKYGRRAAKIPTLLQIHAPRGG